MSTPTQPSGCLATGFNIFISIVGALVKAFSALLLWLYQVLLEGFTFSEIRNKSGFVLFWVTAATFCLIGATLSAAARPSVTAATTATPVVVTVIVTQLAQAGLHPIAATATPIPATFTPAATPTPRPTTTPTATPTATPTLVPETATAMAQETAAAQATLDRAASQTAVAAASTATRAAYAEGVTATAKAAGATQTRRAAQATQTREAKAATADYLAQFVDIDYRELRDYPDQHEGEKVCVRGRVFNIAGSDTLQMYFAGTYDALYVEFEDDFTGIYENSTIRVCGIVYGEYSFQNALGATVSQPAIYLAFIP